MSTGFPAEITNMADLLEHFGDIPPIRIRTRPFPGTATEEDLLKLLNSSNKCLCELIDGTLVEKVVSSLESWLTLRLGRFLSEYLEEHNLGVAFGPDGPFGILPDQVRLPDLSVFLWDALPNQEFPKDNVPKLAPDLAVEVFSQGNTKKEMQLKLRDYFLAGVKQVWILYPKKQTAEVYSSPMDKKTVKSNQALKGGDLLPGFELPLKTLFTAPTPKGKSKSK